MAKEKKFHKLTLFNEAVRAVVSTGVSKKTAYTYCDTLDVVELFDAVDKDIEKFSTLIINKYRG